MDNLYKMETRPACRPESVVQGEYYRITVLTPSLLRLEYSENKIFEDRPTQTVLNRDFPTPGFYVSQKNGELILETEKLTLRYHEGPFSPSGLSIEVRGGKVWRYGEEPHDLGGTIRSLDKVDGKTPLGHGLNSREGYSVYDDSRALVFTEDGWVQARPDGANDLYFFGYGREYQKCLEDFFYLSGRAPLLPRWAFGNWWCRYHKYTDREYRDLIERFELEGVPLSVAVIDMDWHLVEDVDPKYGNGWTGYTWDKKLFPDHLEFLAWLHRHGLKTSLNLHPAQGVRAYEQAYPAIAREMGADAQRGEPVRFDVSDPHFMETYYKLLHHPLEKEGVDFWWIDWQQGKTSKIPGLDPLWMLNHFHYLDSRWKGTRPMILSRFAGLGSHRYPVGFSGDTVTTWETLDFQPYFTATASNVGYGWWSHDIGGNYGGRKDDELQTRWVQFGVFSPVMRLHSSANPFNRKEPWNFDPLAERIMKQYLALRHRLVPYLYTMNRIANREGKPLVRPMYWLEPEQAEAYQAPNEYYFGTELVAAPITKPMDPATCLAEAKAWIPEGVWFDIFTGYRYQGGQMQSLWRGLEHIPVLARAGSMIPLADWNEFTNSTANPDKLEICVFPGADGTFTLWEDEGDTPDDGDDNWAFTQMKLKWGEQPEFSIHVAQGNLSMLPAARQFTIRFRSIGDAPVTAVFDGDKSEVKSQYDSESRTLIVSLPDVSVRSDVKLLFEQGARVAKINCAAETLRLLDRARISYNLKENIQKAVEKYGADSLRTLNAMELEHPLLSALSEILLNQ